MQCAEAEPEPVPEVLSFKKPHRRRRGARKSERKNKLATTQVSNEDSSAGPMISEELETAKAPLVKDDSQWEFVPNDIQDDQDGGWEIMKIKNKSGVKIRSGIQSRDSTPVQSNRLVIQDQDDAGQDHLETSTAPPPIENHDSEPELSSVMQTDEQDQNDNKAEVKTLEIGY